MNIIYYIIIIALCISLLCASETCKEQLDNIKLSNEEYYKKKLATQWYSWFGGICCIISFSLMSIELLISVI